MTTSDVTPPRVSDETRAAQARQTAAGARQGILVDVRLQSCGLRQDCSLGGEARCGFSWQSW
jgi:hypothetical protein